MVKHVLKHIIASVLFFSVDTNTDKCRRVEYVVGIILIFLSTLSSSALMLRGT